MRRALNNVKKNILGSKLAQLNAKGLNAFNLHFSTGKITRKVQQRRQFFVKICMFTVMIISAITAYQTTAALDINKVKLDAVFNPSTTNLILTAASYGSACKILIKKFIDYFISLPYASEKELCGAFVHYVTIGFQFSNLNNVVNEFGQHFDASNKDDTVIANVAGCLLSIFIIFTAGFSLPSALSLVLWTANSILTMQGTDTAAPALAVTMEAITVSLIASSAHATSYVVLSRKFTSQNQI